MFAMGCKYSFISAALFGALASACTSGEADNQEATAPAPVVMLRHRPHTLTAEQRSALGFPDELIAGVEKAARGTAEPFHETVLMPCDNLKGDVMPVKDRLVGFSVRTAAADRVIADLAKPLRSKGYLIFRSEHNYGKVPDVVTVIKGASQYDILTVQKTEGVSYGTDTRKIINWLRTEHRAHPFDITGAGANWVEARFTGTPRDLEAFSRRIHAFAPDVVNQGARSQPKLIEEMKKRNGFYLWWD